MIQEETPFTPFAPPTAPASEPPKRERKSKSKKKAKPEKPPTQPAPTTQAAPAAPKRKRNKGATKPVKRSKKYELQTILKVASALKEADMPAFEKMLDQLQGLPAASRTRILEALGEVFG